MTYKTISQEDNKIILDYISGEKVVNAIKHLRDITGYGLKESKHCVDYYRDNGDWPIKYLCVEEPVKAEPIGWRDNTVYGDPSRSDRHQIRVGLPQEDTGEVRLDLKGLVIVSDGPGGTVITKRKQLDKLARAVLMAYDYIEE